MLIKQILIMILFTTAAYAFDCTEPDVYKAVTENDISYNGGSDCWQMCIRCEQDCRKYNKDGDSYRRCKENSCFNMNVICCKAEGKRPNYKMCGCN
ncbi:MAG: hypothetical protein WC783_04320 [Candidatus Paceibacterota bacterium]